MPLLDTNWNPSHRQLRQFGGLCCLALPGVGWMSGAGSTVLTILSLVGMFLAVLGVIAPAILRPIYVALLLVTTPIRLVMGELVLLATFVLVFWPIGLLFRIISRDRLQLRWKRQSESYWQPKAKPTTVAKYYRQS